MIDRLNMAVLVVCGALAAAMAPTASAQEAETRDSYLIVTRVDQRTCAYPTCGGYFVKSVNKPLTRCADGSLKKECHAVQLHTAALGWTPEQTQAFEKSFAARHAVVRGVLEPAPAGLYTADALTITEAWQGQGLRQPVGTFYGVKSTGIVCITAPCPSLAATKLNVPGEAIHPELDLSLTGASDKQIQAGLEALNTTGILAVGPLVPVKYPALEGNTPRWGAKLVASEFYLPAKP